MFGSKDLNLPFPATTYKQGKEETDLFPHPNQMSSGLLRYRSAPSTLLGDVVCEELVPNRSTSPEATCTEAESMFARFMTEKQSAAVQRGSQSFMPTVEEEEEASEVVPRQSGGLNSSTLQMLFHSPQQQQQQQQLQGLSSAPATAVETPYRIMSSMAVAEEQAKSGGRSSLIRRSSSPAGLFSQLNVDNGFNMMRGMGEFRHGAGSNGESGAGTSGRLKGQISFPSGQGSSRLMSQISEVGSDGIGGGGDSSLEDGGIRNGNASGSSGSRCYIAGYPIASWDDSVMLSDSFSGSKRARDPSENGEMRNHASNLTHHISLPRSSSDMSSMEKFLQFQDAVPCKIRAKRGCATHPRSIAERVRRTKISERMRKLQELVPSMDKQTNTADMLDLAVDYIKDLQKTVKTLSDDRSRCTCSSKPKL